MQADVPKQYLTVGGKTILEHTLERLVAAQPFKQLLLCVSAQDEQVVPLLQGNKVLASLLTTKVAKGDIKTVLGGETRAHSVSNGLAALADRAKANDWVLVHDAARPCIDPRDIRQLCNLVNQDEVGGILAIRAQDTLKYVEGDTIQRTLNREPIWQAQTPQLFRYGVLVNALAQAQKNKLLVTDEASAIEHLGALPKVVEARYPNIKITTKADLALATVLLAGNKLQDS